MQRMVQVFNERTDAFQEFFRPGVKVGQHVLVIRTVAGMVIDEIVKRMAGKIPHEHLGIAAVALDEIPVQVQVAGIAPESLIFRSVLIGPCAAALLPCAIHIVLADDMQINSIQHGFPAGIGQQFACQQHAGIGTFRLAGVNVVVDQQPGFVRRVAVVDAEHSDIVAAV